MRIALGLLALSASALSGCSGVHPLPSDVVRLEVHQIVDRIRCEARSAVLAVFNGEYRSAGLYPDRVLSHSYRDYKIREKEIKTTEAYHKQLEKDALAINEKGAAIKNRKELSALKAEKSQLDLLDVRPTIGMDQVQGALFQRAKALQALERHKRVEDSRFDREEVAQKIEVQTFNAKSKHQEVELIRDKKSLKEGKFKELDIFLRHRLSYKLEFKITHNENISSFFSWKFPIPLGTVSIDQVDPSLQNERYSQRAVQIVAGFEELVDMTSCLAGGELGALPSGSYPIVGEVGLREVVVQYLKIMNHPDKIALKTNQNKDNPETYTDSLRFKTIVSAGASPKISITQGNGHTLTGQLSPDITRTDDHTLTVFLSLEDGAGNGDATASSSGSGKNSKDD